MMDGIYTTSVSTATLDESPEAYKPYGQLLSHIGETVTVDAQIKPIYNFKAAD
jgi:tRNA-splicing ligase RtcB